MLVLISLAVLLAPATSSAGDRGLTTLDVNGEQVRVYRDEFGVPHIFAETNRGLFEAYGYTVAQDRLWQLELNRRAGYGRLAEILGPGQNDRNIAADRNARILRYTGEELDAQLASLSAEDRAIVDAYVAGINRYLTEVVAADPAAKLPFEFHQLQLGAPAPWASRDVVAALVAAADPPPASGRELVNQSLLKSLVAIHGPAKAWDIFEDVYWLNDPDAPVSVPAEGAIGKRQKSLPPPAAQLQGASEDPPGSADAEADALLESLGVPTRLGSFAWVVSAAKSANGFAMLVGGPQQGLSTPSVLHEVQLKGGDGFNVTGGAIAGIPAVIVGRTDHTAFTLTGGLVADLVDHYIEQLCDGGTGSLFNGVCTPFEVREETIKVRGRSPVTVTVQRSVHGPLLDVAAGPGLRISQKRAFWKRETGDFRAALAFNRARNIQEFEQGVGQMAVARNVLYADKLGNIGYWLGGEVPIRPAGFDPRLPFPGDGSAEWPGGVLPIPRSINPTRGWLANWNEKPAVDYDSPDRVFGKQRHLLEIEDHLAAPGLVSLDEVRAIVSDIARTRGQLGREARFLKPYLLGALDNVPSANPLAPQARTVLEAWDGSDVADAATSTHLEPGAVLFSKWTDLMLAKTFGDELGEKDLAKLASKVGGPGLNDQGVPILVNMLIHVLDDALGGGSGVPPSVDYFNGADPNAVISETFDQALAALGPDAAAWSAQPRALTRFRHALFPAIPEVGSVLDAARATYAEIVVLSRPSISGESILPLGQSGFIQRAPSGAPVLDPHFKDQLELYRNFQYKPMRLFRNTQLEG